MTDAPGAPARPDEQECLARIESKVRALHHYGCPPDSRLREDVDGDVNDILDDVRALLRSRVGAAPEVREALVKAAVPLETLMAELDAAPEAYRILSPALQTSVRDAVTALGIAASHIAASLTRKDA